MKRLFAFLVVLSTVLVFGARDVAAQPPPRQGIAVLGMGAAKDEAYILARAVYGSSLRPRNLDEIRARVLAGDPPPSLSSKEVRELSELSELLQKAGVTGGPLQALQSLRTGAEQSVSHNLPLILW